VNFKKATTSDDEALINLMYVQEGPNLSTTWA